MARTIKLIQHVVLLLNNPMNNSTGLKNSNIDANRCGVLLKNTTNHAKVSHRVYNREDECRGLPYKIISANHHTNPAQTHTHNHTTHKKKTNTQTHTNKNTQPRKKNKTKTNVHPFRVTSVEH